MLERPLHQLNLDEIIQGCQVESNQPRDQETGYCFELFRRAFEEQEQAAWLAIDEQYRRLILHWVCDCSPCLSRQEVEEIAPQALPKFWQTLTKSSTPLAERFAHIGALLKYLKRCTISVFRERERRIQRRERIRQRLKSTEQAIPAQIGSEEELLNRIDRGRLLQMVQKWVKTYVTDHQEQRILSLSYEYGLTPAEIVKHYPQEFPDTQTIRRIKERILKRARRALKDKYPNRHNGNGKNKKPALDRASVTNGNNGHKEVTNV